MRVQCDGALVFVSQQAWALPRKTENVIRFVIKDVGWFDLELERQT